jgi:hypothetical protein
MAYEQRDNSGSLFKNDKKTSDTHPDYRGTIMINGVEYWLSAWLKVGQSGIKFMSLSAQPKEARQEQSQPDARENYAGSKGRGAEPRRQEPDPFLDEVPF